MTEAVLLLLGAGLTLVAQFALKIRDDSEWLKRQRMEAHTELLYQLNLGDQAATEMLLGTREGSSTEPVVLTAERLLHAVSRVSMLSPQDTQVAAKTAAATAVEVAGEWLTLPNKFTEDVNAYVDLAQRDIRLRRRGLVTWTRDSARTIMNAVTS